MIKVKDKVPENPDFVLSQLKRNETFPIRGSPAGQRTNYTSGSETTYAIQNLQQRRHRNRRLCGRS